MSDIADGNRSSEVSLFATAGDSPMGSYAMEYDEDGSLALARALVAVDTATGGSVAAQGAVNATNKPVRVGVLNGSWYLQLTPQGPHTLTEIRGPMRIEIAPPKLRISGDIYVRRPLPGSGPVEVLRPITETPLLLGKNWYPQLSIEQYSWYFRSLGVTYNDGRLIFKFERYLWNRTTQEFINTETSGRDSGFMQLDCREGNILTHPLLPQPTLRLTGEARLGGETYDVVATKTSPFQRGCSVEVDVMTNRSFPLSATAINGSTITFSEIYRAAGMDCAVVVDQTNLPEDAEFSTVELQTALAQNRRPTAFKDAWRLWLLVGSAQGDLFGLMFDDVEPFREGTAGFFDPRLPDLPIIVPAARNQKLGDVPAAFLRTLVHESGHAFNMFHPKHDVHNVPIGTTIMNQTGDVMGFATAADPFPGNITFAFDDHCRTSLIHSPDPQVRPGWKRFGWGHGSLSSGIAEPVDAAGFLRMEPPPAGLMLALSLPDNFFRGEFVTAQFTVINTGTTPRTITAALNLSQGDLRLLLKPPFEEIDDVRDVIIACGDRPRVKLKAGESLTGSGQIFYTNVGFTFRQTGRYYVSAELDIGDASGATLRSAPIAVVVRAPRTQEEEDIARLSMSPGVGRAFALGDYGVDPEAERDLEKLTARHGHTSTGMAAGLVLANARSRDLRDLYSGKQLRTADLDAGRDHFTKVAERIPDDDPLRLVHLATGVAAPTEASAPVLDLAARHLDGRAAADRAGIIRPDTVARAGEALGDSGPEMMSASKRATDLLAEIRRTFAGGA